MGLGVLPGAPESGGRGGQELARSRLGDADRPVWVGPPGERPVRAEGGLGPGPAAHRLAWPLAELPGRCVQIAPKTITPEGSIVQGAGGTRTHLRTAGVRDDP